MATPSNTVDSADSADSADTVDSVDSADTVDSVDTEYGPAPALPAERCAAVAGLLKALADPVRLGLFLSIAAADGGSVCVCHLPDLGVAQPTVSHHLRKLREEGLVDARRRGTWVHYAATRRGRAAAEALAHLGQAVE